MTFAATKQDAPVNAGAFGRPASVLPVVAAPLYKSEKYVQVSSEAMDACAGEYRDPTKTVLRITRKGSDLMLRSPRTVYELLPHSDTESVRGCPTVVFRLVKGASGTVTELVIETPTQAIRAEKVK